MIANTIGQDTAQSSIVLACDPPMTGYHETNYSLAYSSHVSWQSPDSPVPVELYPSLAFDNLFENRGSLRNLSIIDRVKESAETLLRKLIEANDPTHGPACFILAVMLERKRILKIKEQITHDGRRVFVYEQPKTGDLFTITDPDLQLSQLDAVQRDVAQLLEHGLNPPAPTPAPETATAPESAAPAAVPPAGEAAEAR